MSAMMACGGGDDDTPAGDAGRDATDAAGGRGGTGGSDAGRADTNTGGGGNAGMGGGGSGGADGGTSDASPDRSIDGQGGVDVAADVAPDNRPASDASSEPDAGVIVDSAADQIDEDGNVVDVALDGDGATPSDTGPDTVDAPADAGTTSDATDAADGSAPDTSDAGDAGSASDVTDAALIDVFDAPSCNDGIPATFDFYNPLYGCGHMYDANPNDADAWIKYDAGFYVDVATALGWAFPPGSRSVTNAAAACDAHSVAGLTNWRMATIDEARSLAGGCARTSSGGTCPMSDPSCLTQSCGWASPACDSCLGGAGPNAGQYCKVDVTMCTFFHTSSACSDCSDASATDWIYIPINGNFYPQSSLAAIPTACVSVVPNGVPATDGG